MKNPIISTWYLTKPQVISLMHNIQKYNIQLSQPDILKSLR